MKTQDEKLLFNLKTVYTSNRFIFPSKYKYHRENVLLYINQNMPEGTTLKAFILKNYLFNSLLWHFEDKARDLCATDYEIAEVKRSIDFLNQQRNNSIEEINCYLIKSIFKDMNSEAILISETPGSLIDRTSILMLRMFSLQKYLQENKNDKDAKQKLTLVLNQGDDLQNAMHNIVRNIIERNWYFKMYFSNKLYNDPRYNKSMKMNDK